MDYKEKYEEELERNNLLSERLAELSAEKEEVEYKLNRIKNNLSYLRDLAITLYDEFDIIDVGADRTRSQYPYADEINNLESNLNTINSHTINRPYGSSPVYYDNAAFVNFDELNRLESAILDLYNRLTNQSEGRRMFTWNFGMKGGTL